MFHMQFNSKQLSLRGFTLLEVLIGMGILTAGVISVMWMYPSTMKANEMAELRTLGAMLAMSKVEEIRRDNDELDKLINGIKNMTAPSSLITFPMEPRLAYAFSARSELYINRDNAGMVIDDPTDPRDNPGIPRVHIYISPTFRGGQKVNFYGRLQPIDEYMFDK